MRSVRNKAAAGAFAAILAAGAFAAPSVEITNVQQQYPWTNTVDITYTVQGVNKTHQTNRLDHIVNDTYFATFEAKSGSTPIADVNGNTIFTNGLVQGNGTFTAQWHPAMDQQLTGCTMTPSVFRGEENAYLVINLETNKQGKCDWWYEPMSTQAESNKRYNTDEYKTKKMVFRRIPANNAYRIGHSKEEHWGNTPHNVKVPEDYYCAVFPMTIAQYNRIIENGDLTSTSKQIMTISWTDSRRSAAVASRPTSGVIYNITSRSGLCIDMPTHAMHEVAIRAGVTTYWLAGTDTDYTTNKRYIAGPKGGRKYDVGLFEPNNWGLFGCLGPGKAWIRDVQSDTLATTETALANAFTPITSGSNNANRGYWDCAGDYSFNDPRLAPSRYCFTSPTAPGGGTIGLRLCVYPEAYYPPIPQSI